MQLMEPDISSGSEENESLDYIYTSFVAGTKFGIIVALLTFLVSTFKN